MFFRSNTARSNGRAIYAGTDFFVARQRDENAAECTAESIGNAASQTSGLICVINNFSDVLYSSWGRRILRPPMAINNTQNNCSYLAQLGLFKM
ncbi:hypothetical protein [Chania multitudinisentens]|uniref:hypothetical protein n=1 Tax=Chania multitudinisentens TaxID=1639108 RepID=UPI003AA82F51